MSSELRSRALKALNKESPYGPSIDLSKFELGEVELGSIPRLTIDEIVRLGGDAARRVGIDRLDEASYVQINEALLYRVVIEDLRRRGIIVMSTAEALRKLPWAKNYYWRLLSVDEDKYTAAVEVYGIGQGYFIYVPPGVKIEKPIFTCLLISTNKTAQLVHNIVIVDDGAELNLITGCATSRRVRSALHIGVSEFYVGKNAKLSFAMIHAWGKGIHVRPRTAVKVSEGGTYVSYYVIYSDVKSIQQYPKVYLSKDAKYYTASIIVGIGKSIYDVGAEAILEGSNSSAEIISRVVAQDEAEIVARARIVGLGPNVKGHIECLGLQLSPKAKIQSIPELESKTSDSRLTHEAAIGRIAEEEIEYLMSRGLDEEEARALILRGFMTVDIPGLPVMTRKVIDQVTRTLSTGRFM